MPITVAYQPSAYAIGNAAYQAGLGELEREQQLQQLRQLQLALQQQGLAEERRQFDISQQFRERGLDLDALNQERQYALQEQQFQAETDLRNRGLEADIFNANRQAELEQSQLNLNRSQFRQQAYQDANQLQAEQNADFFRNASQQAANAQDIWARQVDANADIQHSMMQSQAQMEASIRRDEQQGLRDGTHYYTPEQQTTLRQLNESKVKLQLDPRYSPQDKAAASQMIQQQIDAIRPLPVPADRIPKTMAEQYEANSFPYQDPVSGNTYTMYGSHRSGELGPVSMNPVEQERLKADIDAQKEKLKAELNAPAETAKRVNESWKRSQEAIKNKRDLAKMRLDAIGPKPSKKDYEVNTNGDLSYPGYDEAVQEWQSARRPLLNVLNSDEVGVVEVHSEEELAAAAADPSIPSGTIIDFNGDRKYKP